MARETQEKPGAKPRGWFSRRHQTEEPHRQGREHYENRGAERPSQTWDEESKGWVKV